MIIKNVNLETVCGITSRLPEMNCRRLPSRASPTWENRLINGLLNRKALARLPRPSREKPRPLT
ncbi:MAG: hypothetical protein V8Q27_06270, partial [Eubacteriales bacterium]